MRGLESGRNREAGPLQRNGGGEGGQMRWGSVMSRVCYDVLNQALFDQTLLSTSVFMVSAVSRSTKALR